ncbi:TetR/AcrR family transcriptional regulator [Paenibacillus sp. 19GGS1-52]|uniref:TetR/AcrR family transcriptional regulator n=1 Tax=Paenibacillus sp. 19GGS1-52 TaxID=2758563 RepID=UPI001EFB293A|nr:TetR/AcrR family transcriptional regulator [Paenibacillus sp. 19GGS1-52]ULO05106.1 TetR/AcrR family transcriptional regulator [Paenibacillus sp. 19GGS1-52]
MARHKEFDQEKALESALDLFWTKGYERTSIQDLCTELGIHRGSLYDTFGDKYALFVACLDRFQHNSQEKYYSILTEEGPTKELLERFFGKVIDSSMNNDTKRRGCFMTNAAMEVAATDPVISGRVEAYAIHVESLFYQFLLRAQKNGDVKGKHNLRELARFLANTKQGLHVMGKTAPDRSVLEDVCKVALSVVV